MDNPDYPQTEAQWALKQIFKKGSNRIDALQQTNFRVSSQVSGEMPSIEELRSIRKFVFRIDKNTPQLREVVTYQLERLEPKYPEFDFLATYGGVE